MPPLTEKLDADPASDHGPPTSATPNPLATERPKLSAASTVGVPTVTSCELVSVAPSPSVTVRVTVYEPSAA